MAQQQKLQQCPKNCEVVLMKATFLLADAHEVDDIQFEYIKIKYVQTK